MSKINRNDPCPCGSGKKYKKCCGLNEGLRKKPKIGALGMLSQAAGSKKLPSAALAQRVFKVLSSTEESAPEKPLEPPEALKGYSSLEELIGIEGTPGHPSSPQTPA